MTHQKVLSVMISLTLIVPFLVTCGGAPATQAFPTLEPEATSTQIPPAATPTATDTPVPPSPTPVSPTPEIHDENDLELQSGAVFSGAFEVGEEARGSEEASSGTISFTIAEETSVTSVEITLPDVKCESDEGSIQESGVRITSGEMLSFPITDGSFSASLGRVEIRGRFTSPTEASGTIHVILQSSISVLGTSREVTCDLGAWDWQAKSDEGDTSRLPFRDGVFTLGPADARIANMAEPQSSPAFERPAKPGMKFVLVELEISELQSGEVFASDRILLQGSSGKQYSPLKAYSETTYGKQEGDSLMLIGTAGELGVFFEVAEDEDLGASRLGYH